MQDKEGYIRVKCIQVKQPIGVFYIASMEWYDIGKIARADIRHISRGEGSAVESYLGVQRRLKENRVKDISRYVQNIDATFPTSVILHVKSFTEENKNSDDVREFRNIIFDKETSEMLIRDNPNVAHILDGQHRIEGLKRGFGETGITNEETFQLSVSIFVDLGMDDQSMVFATVNKAQTKVNKSLVYDLFAYQKSRSPQRTAHLIVRLLNQIESSPFKDKVKILGVADDPDRETITQATLAESIISYISKRPMQDRDDLKRGKKIDKVIGLENEKLIFRNLFLENKDENIAKNISNLFSAVKLKWPNHWENTILSKSTGVVGIMRFLRPAYLHLCTEIGEVVSVKEFSELLETVEILGEDFNKEVYLPGASGQIKLYKQLVEQTGVN